MIPSKSPHSSIWSTWKAMKGIYNAEVTVPDADLCGKWVLITGSNSGIGRAAAVHFANSGANLILACRQPPPHETHPNKVVDECKAAGAAAAAVGRRAGKQQQQVIEWWDIDMANLASVSALARRWNDTGRLLDVLVNNAGMAALDSLVLTADGFEMVHQVNFLSHTMLTLSVLPSMAKAPSPRILCTTSCMHYWGVFDLAKANSAINAYTNNKMYLQVWLSELQLRLLQQPEYEHIVVHGVHPGFVRSGVFAIPAEVTATDAPKKVDAFFWVMSRLLDWLSITPQQGALALFHAATAPELCLRADIADEFKGGAKYLNRLWVDDASPYTRDAKSRTELWHFIADELNSSPSFDVSAGFRKDFLVDA